MATARTRRKPEPKPTPPKPLFLRIAIMETDGEETCTEIGPYFAPTADNLQAIRLCMEVLEQQRGSCLEAKPILLVVPFDETYIISELDMPFTRRDAMLLMKDGGDA